MRRENGKCSATKIGFLQEQKRSLKWTDMRRYIKVPICYTKLTEMKQNTQQEGNSLLFCLAINKKEILSCVFHLK